MGRTLLCFLENAMVEVHPTDIAFYVCLFE